VRPDDVEPACEVLAGLGFERQFDQRAMPEWWRGHDIQWLRAADGVTVDLHLELPGIGLDAARAWPVLTGDSDLVTVAGRPLPTLGEPARAMHLALHVSQHGTNAPKPMLDLERGLARLEKRLWHQAAALAARLNATDSFASGLRFTDAGTTLARELGLPEVPSSVRVAMLSGIRPAGAITIEKLVATDGWHRRVAGTWRVVFPPPAYMRSLDPAGTNGVVGLVMAYLRRARWVVRSAPAGFRAYRRARHQVRAGTPAE
jgi:hypothetical protein